MKIVIGRATSDDRGATAIEYGLIAAILAVGLATVLPLLFTGVDGLYAPAIDFFSNFVFPGS